MTSRVFWFGIDLGTDQIRRSRFVDTEADAGLDRPATSRLPQLAAPATVEARDVLPSFHYEAGSGELPPGALSLPWSSADPDHAVGVFAREHGAAVPGRLVVMSAKSWLSHSGVDRTAGRLPWHGGAGL